MEGYLKTFSVETIPDLSGSLFWDGGAAGIGKETAIQLVYRNAKVYVASRSQAKFDKLAAESCVAAARDFLRVENRLDVIVANAALSVVPCTLSKDGIEIQFAVGLRVSMLEPKYRSLRRLIDKCHFVFIHHVLDIIRKTSREFNESRIVVVSSHAHSVLKPSSAEIIDFNDLKVEGSKKLETLRDVQASLQKHARSKLANILFTRSLHNLLQKEGYSNVFVNCLNPGTIGTSSSTDSASLPPWISFVTSSIVRFTRIPLAAGALSTLLLATDPDISLKNLSSRYFDVGPLAGKFWYGYTRDATYSKLSDAARDDELAERLWQWSLEMMK